MSTEQEESKARPPRQIFQRTKARPPREIFQRLTGTVTSEKTKNNVIKYFLVFYLITEILSFFIEMINPQLYYEIIFYSLIQFQFFVLFLFLLKFNFCQRNKIIIYFLLFYFICNLVLPFVLTNESYTEIIRTVTMLLLTILLSLTLFNKQK